jgi:hypothetical protein
VPHQLEAVGSTVLAGYRRFRFKTRSKAITGNFSFSTHNPEGEVLYGIDVLSTLNTADFDWVADYMMLEKNYVNN